MPDDFKVRIPDQVRNIPLIPGKIIIDANNIIAFFQQSFDQV
jgi:hypothetical protein